MCYYSTGILANDLVTEGVRIIIMRVYCSAKVKKKNNSSLYSSMVLPCIDRSTFLQSPRLPNCILCLQLYTLVLALEELERRGVAGVGEAEREEMVVKREELTTKAFVLLRLKPVALASTK